jgi:glycosyltransferase involved in cell wall biosynthesis
MFPIKYTKKLASQLFSRQKKNKSEHDISLRILQNSGKFDATWYLSEYDDIAKEPYWSENSALHYLLHGANEGRDPNAWFDSQWYLSTNPDVATQEMNPLLHYVLHGQREERLPNPYKNLDSKKKVYKKNVSDIRSRLALHLWGGLSSSALIVLEKIYADSSEKASERWSAAWHASRWYYFIGDFEKAYETGLLMLELDSSQKNRKEGVFLRAYCEFQLGLTQKATATLEQYIKINPQDTDALFALSNAYLDDDQERLKIINKAYESNTLLPLSLRDEFKPLDFSNIVVRDVPVIEDKIKVTIIMPVFGAENDLHIAVGSLTNQSWKNIEIIIVDDCSTDKTFDIAQRMAKIDSRIIAIKQKENAGAYAARNSGLEKATGDFITTHDSDDWSHPQKIETQVKYFKENPEKIGICTHWIRAKHNLMFTQNWRPNNSLTHWSQSSFMFKRKVFEELGGWDKVRIGGDTEFIWRVKAKYGRNSFAQIAGHIPLAIALDDESSLTRTKMTHVRTVYFGLRHIYREICARWHRTNSELNIDGVVSRTSMPIPKAMVSRDGVPTNIDVLLVSDFSDDEISLPIYEFLDSPTAENLKVGFFHWPDFTTIPGRLTEKYFNFIASGAITPVVSSEKVAVKHIVLVNEKLALYPVDSFVEVISDCRFIALKNKNVDDNLKIKTVLDQKLEIMDPESLLKLIQNFK